LASVYTEVYSLDAIAGPIEPDYSRQVFFAACFPRKLVPSTGDESRALVKRSEDRRALFDRQQIAEQSLESSILLEEVRAFDSLEVFELSHTHLFLRGARGFLVAAFRRAASTDALAQTLNSSTSSSTSTGTE
jgi:hypothetical protein